jgi:hypothetical protein
MLKHAAGVFYLKKEKGNNRERERSCHIRFETTPSRRIKAFFFNTWHIYPQQPAKPPTAYHLQQLRLSDVKSHPIESSITFHCVALNSSFLFLKNGAYSV